MFKIFDLRQTQNDFLYNSEEYMQHLYLQINLLKTRFKDLSNYTKVVTICNATSHSSCVVES